MKKIHTPQTVLVAVGSVLSTAINREEWDKARICLSILEAIAAERDGRTP